MRDRDAVVVHDRGVGDVAAVGRGRLQNRPDALVGAERDHGIAAVGDRLASALVDHAAKQLSDAAAVFEPHPRKVREMLHAEHGHGDRDQQRHRRRLPALVD